MEIILVSIKDVKNKKKGCQTPKLSNRKIQFFTIVLFTILSILIYCFIFDHTPAIDRLITNRSIFYFFLLFISEFLIIISYFVLRFYY